MSAEDLEAPAKKDKPAKVDPTKLRARATGQGVFCYTRDALMPFVRIEGEVVMELGKIDRFERNAIVDALHRRYYFGFGNAQWQRYMHICQAFRVPANGISSYTGNGLAIRSDAARLRLFRDMHAAIWALIGPQAMAKQCREPGDTVSGHGYKKLLEIKGYPYDTEIVCFKRPSGMLKGSIARFLEPLLPEVDEARLRAATQAVTQGLTLRLKLKDYTPAETV